VDFRHHRAMPDTLPEDWSQIARHQHGTISRRQLLAGGLTTDKASSLLNRGILERRADGVYLLRGAPWTIDARMWTAVLATSGVLRSTSAAYLWGMIDQHRGPIRVAVARRRHLAQVIGVEIYRRDLPPGSTLLHSDLPVVCRSGAVLDHVASVPVAQGLNLLDRALQRGWLAEQDLQLRLGRPLKGNSGIRQVVAALMPGAEAESERLLHRLLRQSGIYGWTANHAVLVAGQLLARLDVAFARQRLAIEVDGFAYHSAVGAFQHDRSRQNELALLGWTVLRFTWSNLRHRPEYVVTTIRAALPALPLQAPPRGMTYVQEPQITPRGAV
jgi:very-short-patch-repair endonuclease